MHAKVSPSKMASCEKCARYKSNPVSSDAAERGNRMHKATELNRPEMLAEQEDREDVMKSLLILQKLRAEYPDFKEIAEARLTGVLTYGTADRLFLGERHAIVVDWKYGQLEVDMAVENLQLGCYAELTFEMYPYLDSVEVIIFQPAVSDEPDRHTYQKAEIGVIVQRMERTIARVEDPSTPPTPDAGNCRWCANKPDCEAFNALSAEVVRSTHGIPMPTNWLIGTEKTAEDRAKLHILATLLPDWAEMMRKENAEAFANGQEIPGFKLVSRSGNWRVTDEESVRTWLLKNGLTEHDLWQFAKINAKKAVEYLAEANSMRDAAEMMEELKTIGACDQGDRIQYLKKSFKKNPVEQLTEMVIC